MKRDDGKVARQSRAGGWRWHEKRDIHRWAWAILAMVVAASLACGIGYYVSENPYPAENRIDDVLGEIEPVVLAEREPRAAAVSPDGKWLLVSTEKDEWFLIDVESNQEHFLGTGGSGAVWVDNNHAVVYLDTWRMLIVPSRETWQLKKISGSLRCIAITCTSAIDVSDIDILRDAKHIYVIEELLASVPMLTTADPNLPYLVSLNWNPDEVETHLAGIPHTTIREHPWFLHGKSVYSPNGRYYIAERPFRDPGSFMTYGQGAMFDAATEKEAAHAYKHYWNTYFLGWAYDSSGAYFMFRPRTADADILHPRHPIYKLLVPGATQRGTPVPMYTPTPTRDASVPLGATVIPLGTSTSPTGP